MTAVVGILNKQAVAIAADSAVTIGGKNGHKIFNKANKLFTLSKHHPVGIMIYNAASFMDTPWETLIKVYRRQLADKAFPTVEEYQKDFIEFLRLKNFYTTTELQSKALEDFALNIINNLITETAKANPILGPTPENLKNFIQNLEIQFDKSIEYWKQQTEYCPEYVDYSFEMFEVYSINIFDNINQILFVKSGLNISHELLLKTKILVYTILRVKEPITSYTGLIFTGFGEEEIYPQLIPLNISIVVDNRLRFYIDEINIVGISNSINGAVRPFAQTDVIDTILRGIDPSLDNIYLSNFESTFNKYNERLLSMIGDTNPLLREQIQNLKTSLIVDEFDEMNRQIKKENYIIPLMNAVSSLAKEDLAEMAESLIYLTYLKRRITFAEESVGGPVDVAVISKGDGFVWIKRKLYFRPELNQHFFDNYFNK